MNSHPQTHNHPPGFTLVELLTVIAIIAILMGLLFPAIGIVKDQARKAEAKTACAGIVAAVKAYNTEYGKYPVGDNTATGDLKQGGNTGNNDKLFMILRAKDGTGNAGHIYNPRRIGFFEGKSVSNPTAPKGGFAETGGSGIVGAFYDPWGGQYGVVIDADYNNEVVVPYTDFATTPPQTGCAAYSMGKDGKLGTAGDSKYKTGGSPSDDIISWQ
jgi:prepilin-type N-terminal cleavage/methylation domain-containing protein